MAGGRAQVGGNDPGFRNSPFWASRTRIWLFPPARMALRQIASRGLYLSHRRIRNMSVGRFQLALRALDLRAAPCPRGLLRPTGAAVKATAWPRTPPWLASQLATAAATHGGAISCAINH